MPDFEKTYKAPWAGLNSSVNLFDLEDGDLYARADNYLIANNGIYNGVSILNISPFFTKPDAGTPLLFNSVTPINAGGFPAVNPTRAFYLSTIGHVWITQDATTGAMTDLGAFPFLTNLNVPLYSLNLQGSMYVPAYNGIAQLTPPATVATLTSVTGGIYIGELGGHLLVASTSEGGTSFPYRLRWSGVYNFGQFNPVTDATAGFQDLSDVEDIITGLFTFGTVGYILRQQGITQINITSNGTAPFQFDHLWKSNLGIGCYYPYTASQFSSFGIFVGQDDVYLIDSAGCKPIGGKAKANIFRDIFIASQTSSLPIIGKILPYLTFFNDGITRSGLNADPTYLSYHLFIPTNAGTNYYIYDIKKDCWSRSDYPSTKITSFPSVILSPTTVYGGLSFHGDAIGLGGNFGQGLIGVGTNKTGTLGLSYLALGGSSELGTVNQTTLLFRPERPKVGRTITFRKVIIDGYIASGNQAITITATYDSLNASSVGAKSGTFTVDTSFDYGGYTTLTIDEVGTSKNYIQLKLTLTSALVVRIDRVTIFGTYEEVGQI